MTGDQRRRQPTSAYVARLRLPSPPVLAPPSAPSIIPCMSEAPKRLVVVGDRVLIAPEEGEERTSVGLYLPPTAMDHQAVQSGRIIATGPGTALPEPTQLDDEPWRIQGSKDTRYVPMQARIGDYALFFRKAAVEITFEAKQYLVVPQAAILILVRAGDVLDEL